MDARDFRDEPYAIEAAEQIRPLGRRVVVRLDHDRDGWETPAGLLIGSATIERERWLRGTVVRVGSRVREVREGERVIVNRSCAYATLDERTTPTERGNEVVLVSADQLELAGEIERAA